MRRTSVAVALLLLLAACTPDPADVAGDPTAGATPPAARGDADALAFTADLIGGGTFDGGEYAGQDLMLWFWAPW